MTIGVALDLGSAPAEELIERPVGKPLLTVSGNLRRTNGEKRAEFDRGMLEGLGMTEVHTSTPWTDDIQVFEGVLARDLLDAIGANGDVVRAVGLNDYAVDIPITDFFEYSVILALKQNGRYMGVRDKGPVWLIYPLDNHVDLQNKSIKIEWFGS